MGFPLSSLPFGALSGYQPVPPPSPLTNALLGALVAANRRPRNRSEWEERFMSWQRPASDTEEERIAATANRVGRAMRHSTFLSQRDWRIVPQGSHRNNTNTRAESDIDLCMCLTDVFFVDGPQNDWPSNAELGREALPFTFEQYKTHIAWCLAEEFGSAALTVGNKAIHLHKDRDDKINADIVAAYVFEQYGPRVAPYWLRGAPERGVAFLANGQRVTNFPEQHYRNGVAKNERTGRRYKGVVRILKRLRNHIAENPEAPAAARHCARATASFLIESLTYNCPDFLFGHASIYDDVVEVLRWLSSGLNDRSAATTLLGMPPWRWWQEVNGLKELFTPAQAWNLDGATGFVETTRAYMAV